MAIVGLVDTESGAAVDPEDILPAQVSVGEIAAGNETELRSYSPADVVALIDAHAPNGGGVGSSCYVDNANGSDETGDGSQGDPWASVSYAVAQAAEGDTIYVVHTGVDYAGANMNKDGMTLVAADPRQLPTFTSTIGIAANNVAIRDIRIADVTGQGIDSNGNYSNRTIERVQIDNVTSNGILIAQGTGAVIRDCVIAYPGNTGIALMGSANNRLSDTLVEGNIIFGSPTNDGITIHSDGSFNPVGQNHIIRNNRCTNNEEQGIDIDSGQFVRCENNYCSENGIGGLSIGSLAANVVISGNQIINNNGGIYVAAADDVLLSANNVQGRNATTLLSFVDATNVRLYGNSVVSSHYAGALVDFSGSSIASITAIGNSFVRLAKSGSSQLRILTAGLLPGGEFAFDKNRWYDALGTGQRLWYNADDGLLFLAEWNGSVGVGTDFEVAPYFPIPSSEYAEQLYSATTNGDVTLSLANGLFQRFVLDAARQITLPGSPGAVAAHVSLLIDCAGFTPTWNTSPAIIWMTDAGSAPTLNTTSGKLNRLDFEWDHGSTAWLGYLLRAQA